jgi:outer membrane protein TolC
MAGANFPEYSVGFSLTLPIKNRSAQADNLRAQFEMQQTQINLQVLRNQAEISIRQAMIGLVQGKAQEEAAHQAVILAQQSLDAEQKKLGVGASTFYNVVLRQRDVTTAQYAEIEAADAYAKSLVTIDEARGATLARNGISFNDALSGTITTMPSPPFNKGSNLGSR